MHDLIAQFDRQAAANQAEAAIYRHAFWPLLACLLTCHLISEQIGHAPLLTILCLGTLGYLRRKICLCNAAIYRDLAQDQQLQQQTTPLP